MPSASCCHTVSLNGVRACSLTAWYVIWAKSSCSQSLRAKPTSEKPGGSRPRFARSYSAGISFFLARSPVTPNITSTHGPATRGILRSRGSRSGLTGAAGSAAFPIPPGFAGAVPAASASGTVMSGTSSCRLLGAQFGSDRLEQLVPGHGELGHALFLEDPHHVVIADAELLQLREDLTGLLVGAVDGVAAQHAVVGGGVQGRLGHRVHGVAGHQLDDVESVGERRVLGGRGGPQRTLHAGALRRERRPARRGQPLLVQLVGQPRVRDRGLALQRVSFRRADLLQPLVDLGVD